MEKNKLINLYIKINKLMMKVGSEGYVTSKDNEADDVMGALFDLDGGEYSIEKFKELLIDTSYIVEMSIDEAMKENKIDKKP